MAKNIRVDKSLIDEINNVKFEVLKNTGLELTTSEATKLIIHKLRQSGNLLEIKKKDNKRGRILIR